MELNLTTLEVGYKSTIPNQTQIRSMLTQGLCLPGMQQHDSTNSSLTQRVLLAYTLKNRCAKQHTLVCYLTHKVC
jgi:hypothetical protein